MNIVADEVDLYNKLFRVSFDIADAVNIQVKAIKDEDDWIDAYVFYTFLRKLLQRFKQQGKRSAWLNLTDEQAYLGRSARRLGFRTYDEGTTAVGMYFDFPQPDQCPRLSLDSSVAGVQEGDHVDKFHVSSTYPGGIPIDIKDVGLKNSWLYLPLKSVMEGFHSYKPSSGIQRLLHRIRYVKFYEAVNKLLAAADKWKREDDSSPPNDIENPKPPNDIEDSNLSKRILIPPEVSEEPNPPLFSNLSERILIPPEISKDPDPSEYSNLEILNPPEEISEDPNPPGDSNLSKRTLTPQVVSGDPNRSEDPNRSKGPNLNKDRSTRKNRLQLYILLMGAIGVMLQTFHQAVKPNLQNAIRLGASFGFLIANIILANWVCIHTGDRPINKWISFFFNLSGTMPVYLGYSMFIPEWYGWIGLPVLCIVLIIVECREKLQKACTRFLEKCVSGVKFLGRCFWSSSSNARLRRCFSC